MNTIDIVIQASLSLDEDKRKEFICEAENYLDMISGGVELGNRELVKSYLGALRNI